MNKVCAGVVMVGIVLCTGCFTVHETPLPEVESVRCAGATVSVEGFQATITEFTPVYGTETTFYSGFNARGSSRGHHARRGDSYFGTTTTLTTSVIAQQRQTDMFVEYARDALELQGFNTRAATPRYRIRADFKGPYITPEALGRTLLIEMCSLFFAGYDEGACEGTFKVYDGISGQLLFRKTYVQERSYCAVSPLWIFGWMYDNKLNVTYSESWLLQTVIDRGLADVTRAIDALTRGQSVNTEQIQQ